MEFTPKNRATVQNMPKLPYAVEEAYRLGVIAEGEGVELC